MFNNLSGNAMKLFSDKRKRKNFIIITSVVLVVAILFAACAIYVNDYYHADEEAIEAFAPMNTVSFHTLENGTVVFEPDDAKTGLIFYQGGKVENDAYKPLMAACASKGMLCVLVEMPFNLAVLDVDAADGIRETYPEIEKWYIGGHSLGGSMAASYVADNVDSFEGLILLGAYSTADLSQTDLDVISVYGSEDKVLNREKYDASKSNLPSDFKEIVIDGGNHACFGMYGAQDRDGIPKITNAEQINITAELIADFVK